MRFNIFFIYFTLFISLNSQASVFSRDLEYSKKIIRYYFTKDWSNEKNEALYKMSDHIEKIQNCFSFKYPKKNVNWFSEVKNSKSFLFYKEFVSNKIFSINPNYERSCKYLKRNY
tara:strand:+ start:5829 stop:6173 length:345 start_codon:yes stop_codon:yes gene_type:complete